MFECNFFNKLTRSREKPTNCDQCIYKCSWKGSLKKHTKVVVSVGGAMIGVGSPGLAGTQLPNCCLHPHRVHCNKLRKARNLRLGTASHCKAGERAIRECGIVDTGRVPYWLPAILCQ